jgi:hypothetical protein
MFQAKKLLLSISLLAASISLTANCFSLPGDCHIIDEKSDQFDCTGFSFSECNSYQGVYTASSKDSKTGSCEIVLVTG